MVTKPPRSRALFAPLAGVVIALVVALVTVTSSALPSSASENPPVPSFATSVSLGGSTYASIPMGDLGDRLDTFWQLFGLSAGSAHWTLETPPGIASNGGIVIEGGSPPSLTVAIRPSNLLDFTALAVERAHARWSNGGLIPGALAAAPAAFVGANDASYAAVNNDGGAILRSKNAASNWARVATAASLSAFAAGACRVTGVESLATGAGSSLYAGTRCSSGDRAGVFEYDGSSWREVGPKLAALGAHASRSVLLLETSANGINAVVATSSSATTHLLVAHSSMKGTAWTTSPSLRLPLSASIISTGSFGASGVYVVWRNRNGGVFAAISTGAGRWSVLPALPGEAETIALPEGDPTTIDALGGHHSTFFVWRLDARLSRWQQTETLSVPIIYGSSG